MNNKNPKSDGFDSINDSNMIEKTREDGLGYTSSSAPQIPTIPQKPEPKPTNEKE